MHLPASDTVGRSAIFDAIGTPAAPTHDDAPAETSFETLLSRPQPQSQPAECCRPDDDEASGAESKAAAESSEQADAKLNDDGDPEAKSDEANPAETGAVLVAPSVVLPTLPAAVEENAAAGEAADAAGDVPRATAAEPVPSELLGPLPAQNIARIEGELKGADAVETAAIAQPQELEAKLADVSAEMTADEVAALPAVENAQDPATENQHGQRDKNEDRASQPQERQVATTAVEAIGAAQSAADGQEGTSPSPTVQPAEAMQSASAAASASTGNSQPATRLPQELLAPAAGQPAGPEQPVTVDAARLLHRVARAFTAAQDGGEVRLRLSPPELGALRLEVRVQDGALVARLETETSAARTAIIENLPALRERLADQGVRIERFDVDLMQRNPTGTPDRPADRQPPEQPPREPLARERRMPQMAEGVVARKASTQELDLRRLNVIV